MRGLTEPLPRKIGADQQEGHAKDKPVCPVGSRRDIENGDCGVPGVVVDRHVAADRIRPDQVVHGASA